MDSSQATGRGTDTPYRDWILGPVATVLGLAAHVLGGGAAPAPLIVIALAALLGMAAAMGRPGRLPGWGVLLASGAVQQFLHLAFAAFSVSTGIELPGTGLPGHGHGQPATPAPGTNSGQAVGHQDLHLLLYLHVAAALLTAYAARQLEKVGARRMPARHAGTRAREVRE